ncbi:pyridoxal-phosphate dependent enzyme [Aquimarina sp. 2201CG1-2-11]|uniref:pyridoxal-phosphate dependent enzyme n=1 Tax=Aquimarina discodermiae TaxID=3231043 RepID=UPI003462147F
MISMSDITNTYQLIKNDIYETPLIYSSALSAISGANVYLKMEHLQHTGSFKIRGLLSKLYSVDKEDFEKTFVAASTGNHAAAFGYASKVFGFRGVLFLPHTTSKVKVKALQSYDLTIHFYGKNSMEAEQKAVAYAKEIQGIMIHPYNDLEIIKGQGTIGLEIKKQLPNVDVVLTPVGGGGLVAGIASYFKEFETEVVGCQPKNAAEMYESVQNNRIVKPSIQNTISDATAGGIEDKAITFDICKKHLSSFELIQENTIKKAIAFIVNNHHTLIEPASALPVAALFEHKKYQGKNVVLVLTGKKINTTLLTEILIEYDHNY